MITNFIHNRKDPAPNLIKGYCRTTLVRSATTERRRRLRDAWLEAGINMSGHHFLSTPGEKMAKYAAPGMCKLKYNLNWRNYKSLTTAQVRSSALLSAYFKVTAYKLQLLSTIV
jgi:hypothetical protein